MNDELAQKRQQRAGTDLAAVADPEADRIVDRPPIMVYERDLGRLQIFAHEHGLGDSATALRRLLEYAELGRRVIAWLEAQTQENDLAFSLVCRHERHGTMPWSAAMEWGREAPDSPMVGAASYGMGDSALEAVKQILDETRLSS